MKTLDEVITAMENLTTCDDTGFSYIAHDDAVDALFYLTVFRVERKHPDELHREMVKENDNNPLTWDELKQMEGKPVWIEADHMLIQYTGWALLSYFCGDHMDIFPFEMRFSVNFVDPKHGEFFLMQDYLGKTWQAYRKERS